MTERESKEKEPNNNEVTSIGVLLAGVAHELNNPLTGLVVNLELARLSLEENQSAELQELLEEARQATERVRRIIQELGISPAQESPTQGGFALEGVLEQSLKLASAQLRCRGRLQKEYSKAPKIAARAQRLGQAFLHLLTSIVQSLSEGDASDNEIKIRTGTDPAGKAAVWVYHTGPISPEGILEISLCRCLVESMQGELSYQSEAGQGTSIQLLFPASSEPY